MIAPELLAYSKKFLDWDLIKAKILNFSLLKESTENLLFSSVSEANLEHYNTLTSFIETLNDDNLSYVSNIIANNRGLNDLESIHLLNKGAVLNIEELHKVAVSIESYFKLYKIFKDLLITTFELNSFKQKISKSFLSELRSFVDEEGAVNLLGHPLVKALVQEHKLIDEKIRKTLQFLTNDPLFQENLRFTGHDIINDRFVVAVRSDSYSSQLGQIIDRSDSGQTLYLEPHSLKELNQKRIEVLVKIDEVVHKICVRLSRSLAENFSTTMEIIEYLYNVDMFMTLVKFYHSGPYTIPTLTDKLELKLDGFFHPLIENPIKNDFEINEKNKGLVISGPNTGGKTATLKALAMAVLFSKHGLPIPALDARIGNYKNVYYFGSDHQDLAKGLSSFSAEVLEYNSLFQIDIDKSLIIIDEIFNSTASDEASALASGLVEELTSSFNCHIFISTHHQLLKTIFHQKTNFLSSHVGFDLSKNAPTYKLHLGTPGSSYALNIFKMITPRSIFKSSILSKAKAFLQSDVLSYEELIMKLSKKENEIDLKLKTIDERERKLQNFEKSQEGLLKLRLETEYQQFKNKMDQAFDEVEELLEKVKEGEVKSSNRIFNKKSKLLSSLIPNKTIEEKDLSHIKTAAKITIGKTYFSIKLNKLVNVLSINERKNEAFVQAGLIKVNIPLSDLYLSTQQKATSLKKDVKVTLEKNLNGKIEYDCRGMRLEEFESLVQLAISDLLSESLPFVSFIHGHGSGVLKKWLRDYVKNNPDIKIDKSDSGNDGETRVVIS